MQSHMQMAARRGNSDSRRLRVKDTKKTKHRKMIGHETDRVDSNSCRVQRRGEPLSLSNEQDIGSKACKGRGLGRDAGCAKKKEKRSIAETLPVDATVNMARYGTCCPKS